MSIKVSDIATFILFILQYRISASREDVLYIEHGMSSKPAFVTLHIKSKHNDTIFLTPTIGKH